MTIEMGYATETHGKTPGVVCAGHAETARAGAEALMDGGNAFDAALAAYSAACVCEPALASPGGGGFLLAVPSVGEPTVYDFFVQTPSVARHADEMEFFPISTDFGSTTQEFHIGMGSVAVPGIVRGLFEVHRDLCSLPIRRLLEPGIDLARNGVVQSRFQALVFNILSSILTASEGARRVFAPEGEPCRSESVFRNPDLASTLEALAREGDSLFYSGDIGRVILSLSGQEGGQLTEEDLSSYRVIKRSPLSFAYRNVRILSNPPPSSGGILIAFALGLLERADLSKCRFGSLEHIQALAAVMETTNEARLEVHSLEEESENLARLLAPDLVERYRRAAMERIRCTRGTTHLSAIDGHGNIAALSVSNGEGCGYVIPGTGIMLNNMLGEEDLHPGGFHSWAGNRRMTSMMAPTAAFFPDGRRLATGSGGSNRLRTAILQVLVNLIEMGMPLQRAVQSPRVHWERGRLCVEGGFDESVVRRLRDEYEDLRVWDGLNLFFGGTHSAIRLGRLFEGAGDPRREGMARVVSS